MRFCSERGSGTVLSLGGFLALALLGGLTFSAGELAVRNGRLQALADTFAVAASDALQGLNSGIPCEVAEDLARQSLVQLHQCLIVGQSAHISLLDNSLGIVLSAEAIAEPMH